MCLFLDGVWVRGGNSPGLGSVVGGSFFSNLLCVFLGTNLLGKGANEYGGAFFSKINFLVNMSVPPRFWVVAFVMWDLLE